MFLLFKYQKFNGNVIFTHLLKVEMHYVQLMRLIIFFVVGLTDLRLFNRSSLIRISHAGVFIVRIVKKENPHKIMQLFILWVAKAPAFFFICRRNKFTLTDYWVISMLFLQHFYSSKGLKTHISKSIKSPV